MDTLRETLQIRLRDRYIQVSKHDLVRKGDAYTLSEDILQRLSKAEEENTEDDSLPSLN